MKTILHTLLFLPSVILVFAAAGLLLAGHPFMMLANLFIVGLSVFAYLQL